jgi:transcriptional regulator with XRE-family HTH domain
MEAQQFIPLEKPKRVYYRPLLAYMNAHGITQAQIAKRVGVSQSTVSFWVTGARPVPERHQGELWSMFREVVDRVAEDAHQVQALVWDSDAVEVMNRELHEVMAGWYWSNEEAAGVLYARLGASLAALRTYTEMDAEKLRQLDSGAFEVMGDAGRQIARWCREIGRARPPKREAR